MRRDTAESGLRGPVLLHYHIFKNAGSSVDRLLAATFGESWAAFEGAHASDVLTPRRLGTFLDERPTLRAVSSHLARPPLPGPHCFPIVMLRHPIDRARSVFQFVRRDPAQHDHPIAARGFAHYVAWALDTPDASVSIRNYQTIHLSDASFRTPSIQHARPTLDDLAQARSLLQSWPALGLVRAFDASCRLFEACYQPVFPELSLAPLRENASPDAAPTEAEAVEAVRVELGEALFARLADANALDLALYAFAAERFARLTDEVLREEIVRQSGSPRPAAVLGRLRHWLR